MSASDLFLISYSRRRAPPALSCLYWSPRFVSVRPVEGSLAGRLAGEREPRQELALACQSPGMSS